jgi:hypothetical protein
MWYGSYMESIPPSEAEVLDPMTIMAIRHKKVYMAGRVVGEVIHSEVVGDSETADQVTPGLKVLIRIEDEKAKRYLAGGAAEFSVTV